VTHSKADLLANETTALQLFAKHCVDAPIHQDYKKDLPHFKPILDTTWTALADHDCIRLTTIWHFQLTPQGWIKAQDVAGTLWNPKTKVDLGLIAKSLKEHLNGRSEPVLVGIDQIVNETKLPHHWVVNVINSHLIEHCLHQKDADWAPDDDMESVILVPNDIGHSK
jgi:hypothetical protein